MSNKKYYIGEVSRISGLTIRTLQHYDNIGLLPASGREDNGRRYYTNKDIMVLEQVVFYRDMGFALSEIKEEIIHKCSKENVDQILEKQSYYLLAQIEQNHTRLTVIETCQEISDFGLKPPWALLSQFIRTMEGNDLTQWADYKYSDEQLQVFNEDLPTLDKVMDFYHKWKNLSIKAAAFHAAGMKPKDTPAQKLAQEWIIMLEDLTGGDETHLDAYLDVESNKDVWREDEKILIDKSEVFLTESLRIYQISN